MPLIPGALHPPATHGAGGGSGGEEALPDAVELSPEREPLAVRNRLPALAIRKREALIEDPRELTRRDRCHATLLHTPTTRPITCASRVRIGSSASFSGCSRT